MVSRENALRKRMNHGVRRVSERGVSGAYHQRRCPPGVSGGIKFRWNVAEEKRCPSPSNRKRKVDPAVALNFLFVSDGGVEVTGEQRSEIALRRVGKKQFLGAYAA